MEDFIGVFAIFCAVGLPVMGWILFRVLAHRERMEMIRHGIVPEIRGMGRRAQQQQSAAPSAGTSSSSRSRDKHDHADDSPEVTLRKGIRLTMIGFALTIGLSFIDFNGSLHPGPWLLFGLIPMFVGIGHILIAVLSGATIGIAPQSSTYAPGPGPFSGSPIPPGSPPPTYDASYTYRPGDRTELRPPLTPPDRR